MKAAVCREFGAPLVIEELVIDSPIGREIKVDVAACAICHSDIHYAEGAWGGTLPTVYGHEAAGVITEVGPLVTNLSVGDHVIVSLLRSCGACYYCDQGLLHACEGSFAADAQSRIHTKNGESVLAAMHCGAFAEEIVVDQSQAVAIPKEIPLDSASPGQRM